MLKHPLLVTEDPEVYHAHVPLNERDGVNVFGDKLIAAAVTKHKFVHFEMILEMDQNKATKQIYHQAYSRFQEYNLLVKLDNDRNLGSPS